jgi:hypothetical protein
MVANLRCVLMELCVNETFRRTFPNISKTSKTHLFFITNMIVVWGPWFLLELCVTSVFSIGAVCDVLMELCVTRCDKNACWDFSIYLARTC